jgi:hypothetical protein
MVIATSSVTMKRCSPAPAPAAAGAMTQARTPIGSVAAAQNRQHDAAGILGQFQPQ